MSFCAIADCIRKSLSKCLLTLWILSLGLTACVPAMVGAQVIQSNKPRQRDPQIAADDLQALAQGNTAFALDLYRALRSADDNLFYSPYSISVALAMTYAGARGQTAEQMARALHFTLSPERLHPAFNALGLDLAQRPKPASENEGTPFELSIANALWGQRDFAFRPEFLDLLAQNYGAGMRLVDFNGDPERSRLVINRWVSDETRDKIKDLIPAGAINPLTRLVLTNAIYFKAGWLYPFEKSATQPAPFYRLDGSTVEVEMMHLQKSFRYAHLANLQVLELPYQSGDIAMVIILPDEGQFRAVEENLSPELLAQAVSGLDYRPVNLSLPRFTYESQFNLNEALKKLGMVDAFEADRADFSGMTGKTDLFISQVLHKAFIAVDEKGTEAAAATAVLMELTSAPVEQEMVEFKVDRPFIFLISDQRSGSLLFLGRVLNP